MKIKAMVEKRDALYNKAQEIFNATADEGRELTAEEETSFASYCDQVERYDKLIDRAKEMKHASESLVDGMDPLAFGDFAGATASNISAAKQFAADVRSVAGYIRAAAAGKEFVDTNMGTGDNGAIIPNTILKKIVEKVAEITPLYQLSNRYIVKGSLTIPQEDESEDSITVSLATEFQELTSHASKLGSITLNPALYGALVKVSRKLINDTDFELVNWLIGKLGMKLALWIDNVYLNGVFADGEPVIDGVANSYDDTNMKLTLASKSEITADELIDLQEMIPDTHQNGAFWVMNRKTRAAIRKLKDGEGRYLLVTDNNARFGKRLLESDVYTTAALPKLGTAEKNVIIYINPAGVAIDESTEREIQVLRELFATQYAVGVVLWGDIDIKVENTQMVAVAATPAD